MLSHVRQGRRGVEEMLDQAANVLAGMGATRETLKVPPHNLLLPCDRFVACILVNATKPLKPCSSGCTTDNERVATNVGWMVARWGWCGAGLSLLHIT